MRGARISLYCLLLSGILLFTGCQTPGPRNRDGGTTGSRYLCCYNVTTYSQSFSPKGPTNQTTLKKTQRVCEECGMENY